MVYNYTWAYTNYPLKCILDPLTYRNEGSYRPFKITAPPGSILNADYPKAVSSRHLTGHCITAAVFGALAPILPERVIADSGSTPQYISFFAGLDQSIRPFSLLLFLNGGMGASHDEDGLPCTPFPSNPIPGSVEVLESVAPPFGVEKGAASGLWRVGPVPRRVWAGDANRGDLSQAVGAIDDLRAVGIPSPGPS